MFRQNLSIMFLGTASGGGPSDTRNCSSLLCDFMDDLSIWLVDCAEGTLRQFQMQPQEGFKYRANKVTKIFITHMHADHIMGIVPFLRCVLFPPEAGKKPAYSISPAQPKVEIYGPAGLRTFVRQIMKMTLTYTADTYVVHELLTKDDPVTPCDLPDSDAVFDYYITNPSVMHVSEVRGSDILPDDKGFWRNLASGRGRVQDISVDAGSIQHRDPCLGYVFREHGSPNRKIVILGDTYDPSQITPLCLNPSPTLLIHEATDAAIPSNVDQEGKLSKREPEAVVAKAILRGHSVPSMAGTFAKETKAKALVLNHIGGRFPAPRNPWEPRATIMEEIERQATEAWGTRSSLSAVAAQDFLRINVPMSGLPSYFSPVSRPRHGHGATARPATQRSTVSSVSGTVDTDAMHANFSVASSSSGVPRNRNSAHDAYHQNRSVPAADVPFRQPRSHPPSGQSGTMSAPVAGPDDAASSAHQTAAPNGGPRSGQNNHYHHRPRTNRSPDGVGSRGRGEGSSKRRRH